VNNKNDGIGKFALKLFSIIVLVSICLVALLFVICIKIQSAVYEQPFPPSLGDPHFLKAVTRSVGMPISEINKRAYIEDLGPWKAKILIDEFKPIGKLSDREQAYKKRQDDSLLWPILSEKASLNLCFLFYKNYVSYCCLPLCIDPDQAT